jgi:predicted dehydrogenase
MHLLVIGAGSIGKRHLRNLDGLGVSRLSVVDVRPDRLEEAREAVPGVTTFADLDAALDQPDLSAAVVCSSTSTHTAVATKLVRRGLNVLMEKPLAHSGEGLDELQRELDARGLWMMVAYSLRYHPGIRLMRDLLQEGVLGRVLSVRAECGQYLPDWHPWEDYRSWYMAHEDRGGGALLDLSHEIDYLRWFFGEVDGLSALVTKVSDLEIDTDDLSELTLRFRSGVVANVHLDLLQRTYRRTFTIIGAEGTLHWDYTANRVQYFTAASGEWTTRDYEFDKNEYFLAEVRSFLSCLRGEGRPLVDFADGRKTLEVVLAAKRSSRERRWLALYPRGA